MVVKYEYQNPKNIKALCLLLEEYKDKKIKFLAGGTDLLVDIRNGFSSPEIIIDLKNIKELQVLKFDKKTGLHIGGTVVCNKVVEDKIVNSKYPLIAKATHSIASYQLRNRATVVGNICTSSPAADMSPTLLTLQAEVVILNSKNEERIIALKDFYKGVKKNVLENNEIVKEIIIPASMANAKGDYLKLKRIKGHDLSLVGVAISKKDKVRVAIGSAYITSVLLPEFPKNVKPATVYKEALKYVKPITDIRASKEYRLHIINVYINKILKNL